MTAFDQIATKIIREQELIIGPIAWQEAGKVSGIHVIDPNKGTLSLENTDGGVVIDRLIGQYEHLFGRASREASREAVAGLIADLPQTEIPSSLR